MSAYVIVQITVNDPVTYSRYMEIAPPTIALYDPSAARAREWWASPEYEEARSIRQRSADTGMLLIEGLPPGKPF